MSCPISTSVPAADGPLPPLINSPPLARDITLLPPLPPSAPPSEDSEGPRTPPTPHNFPQSYYNPHDGRPALVSNLNPLAQPFVPTRGRPDRSPNTEQAHQRLHQMLSDNVSGDAKSSEPIRSKITRPPSTSAVCKCADCRDGGWCNASVDANFSSRPLAESIRCPDNVPRAIGRLEGVASGSRSSKIRIPQHHLRSRPQRSHDHVEDSPNAQSAPAHHPSSPRCPPENRHPYPNAHLLVPSAPEYQMFNLSVPPPHQYFGQNPQFDQWYEYSNIPKRQQYEVPCAPPPHQYFDQSPEVDKWQEWSNALQHQQYLDMILHYPMIPSLPPHSDPVPPMGPTSIPVNPIPIDPTPPPGLPTQAPVYYAHRTDDPSPGLFVHHEPHKTLPRHTAYGPDGIIELPLPPCRNKPAEGTNDMDFLTWRRAAELGFVLPPTTPWEAFSDQFWRAIGDDPTLYSFDSLNANEADEAETSPDGPGRADIPDIIVSESSEYGDHEDNAFTSTSTGSERYPSYHLDVPRTDPSFAGSQSESWRSDEDDMLVESIKSESFGDDDLLQYSDDVPGLSSGDDSTDDDDDFGK